MAIASSRKPSDFICRHPRIVAIPGCPGVPVVVRTIIRPFAQGPGGSILRVSFTKFSQTRGHWPLPPWPAARGTSPEPWGGRPPATSARVTESPRVTLSPYLKNAAKEISTSKASSPGSCSSPRVTELATPEQPRFVPQVKKKSGLWRHFFKSEPSPLQGSREKLLLTCAIFGSPCRGSLRAKARCSWYWSTFSQVSEVIGKMSGGSLKSARELCPSIPHGKSKTVEVKRQLQKHEISDDFKVKMEMNWPWPPLCKSIFQNKKLNILKQYSLHFLFCFHLKPGITSASPTATPVPPRPPGENSPFLRSPLAP